MDPNVVKLLDEIVVGTSSQAEVIDYNSIDKDILLFTQQLSGCSATITPTQGALKQYEVGTSIEPSYALLSVRLYPLSGVI